MSFGKAYLFGTTLVLVAACGGSVFNTGGEGEAGSSNNAGSKSQAGSSSQAGNGSGTGGASSSGGSKGMGGSVVTAGTVGVGGMNCGLVLCAYPDCAGGAVPVTRPGECCPTCPAPQTGCDGVMCQPVMECPAGYEMGMPIGACCEGCVPTPGAIACQEIACPPENHCPLGYAPGDTLGGCCYDCVPDPRFCNTKDECIVADRPRPCCGCPEAISMRQYEGDACWSAPSMPRMIPQDCYPAQICDAICGACPPVGPVVCAAHRCTQLPAP